MYLSRKSPPAGSSRQNCTNSLEGEGKKETASSKEEEQQERSNTAQRIQGEEKDDTPFPRPPHLQIHRYTWNGVDSQSKWKRVFSFFSPHALQIMLPLKYIHICSSHSLAPTTTSRVKLHQIPDSQQICPQKLWVPLPFSFECMARLPSSQAHWGWKGMGPRP